MDRLSNCFLGQEKGNQNGRGMLRERDKGTTRTSHSVNICQGERQGKEA